VYVQGMRNAIEAVAAGRLQPWALFTHQFELKDLARGFDAACTRPEGFMKAVVLP
jgi:NADPH:quinone reductase